MALNIAWQAYHRRFGQWWDRITTTMLVPFVARGSIVEGESRVVEDVLHDASPKDEGDVGAPLEARQPETLPSANHLANILDHVNVGVAHMTLDGRCTLVNEQLCVLMGYSRAELLSRRFYGLTPPHAFAPTAPHGRRLLDLDRANDFRLGGGEVQTCTMEKVHERRDGSTAILHCTVSLTRTSLGEPDYLVWVVDDVTERKKVETSIRDAEDGERRRIARDLHDIVMQDLVYALQYLRAMQEEAANPSLEADLNSQIEALQRATLGLRTVVYNLHHNHDGADGSLLSLLTTLVEMARRVSPHHEIEFVVVGDASPLLPPIIAAELSHIVREALANARRHSGGRFITVTMAANESEVTVEVADDGHGFDVDLTGGGVGLEAMRARTEGIGASLTVKSAPGEGVRVALHLAIARSTRAATA